MRSQVDPMATPPARVAFNTASMLSYFFIIIETTNEARQLPTRENTVFKTALSCMLASAELNEGQKMKRNTVPIIPNNVES